MIEPDAKKAQAGLAHSEGSLRSRPDNHPVSRREWLLLGAFALPRCLMRGATNEKAPVLDPDDFEHYINYFNSMEDENRVNFVSNADSWAWLRANIPLFQCPDRQVEEIYYFRWWSLRKHLCRVPQGFVFTEFITRSDPISSALGHHLNETRWLHDQKYVDDYVLYWLRGEQGGPHPNLHKYSSWLEDVLYRRYLVTLDRQFVVSVLDDLVRDYEQWERERQLPNGLFWQYDVRDAMEESISGSRTEKNARPTINSYMFGNARAIAAIARLSSRPELAAQYEAKAVELKRLTQANLWDPEAHFFKVRYPDGRLSDAREAIGFIPWYFELPDTGYESAWARLADAAGFRAPYGITTAERSHPEFRSHGCCRCEWDGAVWPYATSQTLVALANVLRDYRQSVVTRSDYFDAFMTYVRSQRFDGKPYIGEYLDETTGHWLKDRQERSRYYNHSTFADLLITGLVGLRPRADDVLEVDPLLPDGAWESFCLDQVRYHGHMLSIIWDRRGRRYGKGSGLRILADGRTIARSDRLRRLTGKLAL